jgi:hypothetical protein
VVIMGGEIVPSSLILSLKSFGALGLPEKTT